MKKELEKDLVSKSTDTTGITFSGIIWVIMVIALIMSTGYAIWIQLAGQA